MGSIWTEHTEVTGVYIEGEELLMGTKVIYFDENTFVTKVKTAIFLYNCKHLKFTFHNT